MLLRIATVLLFAALFAAACKAPPPAAGGPIGATPTSPALRERLSADDVLNVTVYGHPDLSTDLRGARVDYDGNVDLPLLGPVQVTGLTMSEARETITLRAARFVNDPSVSVSVLQYAPRMIYVLGLVQVSGAFPMAQPMSALQALSLGGGFVPGADAANVALLRRTGDELQVSFFDAASPGVDGMVPVEPGDVLFVRRSGAGTFTEQVLPYLTGLGPPTAAISSLILIADRADKK